AACQLTNWLSGLTATIWPIGSTMAESASTIGLQLPEEESDGLPAAETAKKCRLCCTENVIHHLPLGAWKTVGDSSHAPHWLPGSLWKSVLLIGRPTSQPVVGSALVLFATATTSAVGSRAGLVT